MNRISKSVMKLVSKVVNSVTQEVTAGGDSTYYDPAPEMKSVCRCIGAEGIVMLKNNNSVLPVKSGKKVSVFGRVQNETFFVGYGSGGDVKAPYKVSIMQGIRNSGIKVNEELAYVYASWCAENPVDDGFWGHWPMCYEEMSVSRELCTRAASKSDTAIVVIGRAAGEDRENKLEKGSYYLTDNEKLLLTEVTAAFSEVVLLLNCGGIMDMSEINEYGDKISSILYVWQNGMETGNAIADVLSGAVSPSGKLTDTVASSYLYYPSSDNFGAKAFNNYAEDIYVGYRYFETFCKDKVLYPFGFGLTYSKFELDAITFEKSEDTVIISADVKNIGDFEAKEVLQVYFEAPCGRLGKPLRTLAAFEKTDSLKPGQVQNITLRISVNSLASYDDEELFAYILEKGEYRFYLGFDVRSAEFCGSFETEEDTVTQQLSQTAAPTQPFKRMKALPDGTYAYKDVPIAKYSLKEIITENLPEQIERTDKQISLNDVKNGKASLDEFVATLSNDELEALSRGDYIMNSPLGAPGNAAVFCGVLPSLIAKGVPSVSATDGPSGIRLKAKASLLPIGATLASSWNPALVQKLYEQVGLEMKQLGSDVLLAPGMNVHRSPLCGRNFEYFSEDPLLTGLTAVAVVKGLQSVGVSACPKHFACNSQETNRTHNDSRVSERALREIYLKGFEICVKESKPLNIMTSYNKINGVWGHYHYELCTRILRDEWGFEGSIMTDWWMRSSKSPEFPAICDQAYRVRAGVNVLMPGGGRTGKKKPDGTLLKTLGKDGGITLGELQQNAKYVLNYAMNSSAMK